MKGGQKQKLLEFLKNTKRIRSGKLKKFNLWERDLSSIEKTLNREWKLFFVIDTDHMQNTKYLIPNIKFLKLWHPHNFCLIAQDSNLEDELLSACNINNYKTLCDVFYSVANLDEFKTKFAQDKNLSHTLKNNFDFLKFWEGRARVLLNFLMTTL